MSKNSTLQLDFSENKNDLLSGLNQAQKTAVTHQNGPLLIIAGAGTGKTAVITRRIAHIIAEKWAKPNEILALTFTDKAASEMEERVDQLVPYGFVDTEISTFNAFGDRFLRDFAIDIGLPANFKVLTKTEQAIFLRQNLYAFDLKYFRPISNPLTHIDALLSHFSRLKDELITAEEYLEFAQNSKFVDQEEAEKTLELANAFARYQELMIQSGNLDYGDQIYLTYHLLKNNKKVLAECQKRFKYILVDEFQDTNSAQFEIVKLLASEHKNITVVGDDDQSIYRFRGASISNILSFKAIYPETKEIVLTENYRSTQEILDASYKLITHNNPDRLEVQSKIDKKLTAKKHGTKPELIFADTLSSEADEVANKILELKKQGYKNSDFAILSRANNHLEPFIAALNLKNIPNIFVGTSSLFQQPEIKMLVAFFKTLVYPDDNLSFFHLATSEIYNLDEEILIKYYGKAKRENKYFEEMFAEIGLMDNGVSQILDDLKKYRSQMKEKSAGELLYDYLKEKELFKKIAADDSVKAEVKIQNIARFFDRIYAFDHTSDDKSLLAFLNNLELILSVGDEIQSSDIDPDLDAVNLMTAHASKGLEWPVVFVVNMVSDRFPSRDRRERLPIPDELIREKLPEGDFHKQEERRLFYVACTRAKDNLFITAAADYGGKRAKKLSQFALELFDDPNLAMVKHKLSPIERIEKFKPVEKPIAQTTAAKSSSDVLKMSRQQIDDYHTCPKKYYYTSILKIPLPTNWHFTYGTAIHEAIGRYYQRKINGEKPEFSSVIEDFEQSFKSEGFITREHEEERKREGLKTLERFFVEDQKLDLKPKSVENWFEFTCENIKITGRYDLIIRENEKTVISDFKTSAVKDQKDANKRVKDSTQMKIYALAWQQKFGELPITKLIFIESNIEAEYQFGESDLYKVKEMILAVGDGVRSGNFDAKPDARQCQMCSFNEICPDAIGS